MKCPFWCKGHYLDAKYDEPLEGVYHLSNGTHFHASRRGYFPQYRLEYIWGVLRAL